MKAFVSASQEPIITKRVAKKNNLSDEEIAYAFNSGKFRLDYELTEELRVKGKI